MILALLTQINYYIETIDNILNNNIKSSELENTTDVYSIKLKDLWSKEKYKYYIYYY